MQLSKISGATMFGAGLAILIGTAATADTIYVGSPGVVEKRVVVPGRVLVPDSTTVIEKHVVVPQPAPTIVEERSVIVPQVATPTIVEERVVVPAEPETIMKRSVTIGTRKPAVTTESTEVSLQTGPAPVFHKRIQNMKEQVDLGVTRGLMTSSAADSFKARLDGLRADADSVVAAGTPKDLSDQLERRLNGINIEISDSMSPSTQIGSGTQLQ